MEATGGANLGGDGDGRQRPLVLLVNPSSGGGRALKLLPRVEAVLDERRIPFREVRTKSLEHGVAKALDAAEAGELPVVVSGDGMIGAIGGAMVGGETPLGIVPVGRGNDLARVLGIPTEPEAAIEVVLAGHVRTIDVGEANGHRFLGIASLGFDSDANRIANESRFGGNLVYAYAALRALVAWKPARFTIAIGDQRTRMEGYSVVVANNKAYGGGMFVAPDADLEDGEFDVVTIAKVGKLRFLGNLPKVFKGTHVNNDEVQVVRASRLSLSASRPFAVYADGEHLTDLPADLRVIPRALRVLVPPGRRLSAFGAKRALARGIGAASRRSGRGGGTTLPGRVLLRMEPEAIAKLGTGLTGGSTIISATNGKTTTAGMLAAILIGEGREPVHNRAGSNMTWGVATALLEQRGTEGLFEVDEAWLPRVAQQLHPRLIVLGNLFRDQLDRYGEMEALAEEWAKAVAAAPDGTGLALNADDPLIADLGRDPDTERPREGTLYFGIEDHSQALPELQHAFDAKHCRRCGHPYAYEVAFVGHLGHYSCPNCGAQRPRPDVAATRIELRGMEGSAATVRVPGGEVEVELPLPGLYNVYNSLAAIAAAIKLGVAPERVATSLREMRAAFGRVETIPIGDGEVSILLIKNPAGANEVLRTLKLEAEHPTPHPSSSQKCPDSGKKCELDLWVALNDGIADGRDVSWVWDADFEVLTGTVRRVTCAGTRAPEMALRLKYAGWPEDRIVVEPDIATSLDAAVAGATGRLFALPTYTALLELRKLLADRGLAKEFWQ